MHLHILHYRTLPYAIEIGADDTLYGCKVIAQAYVVKKTESLWQRFPNLKLFNATKLFSPICFSANLTLFHQNGHLWLQTFLEHFCTSGGNFFDERRLKFEL